MRLYEIDILYTVGIILAILGHSHPNDWNTFPGEWIEFIYLFHMPLFFSIAGFLLANSKSIDDRGYGRWLKGKALRLLVPYFALSILSLAPKYAVEHGGLDGLEIQYIISCFFAPRQNIWGHFWFLPVLFLLYALAGVVCTLENRSTTLQYKCILWGVLLLSLAAHFLRPDILWLGLQDLCIYGIYVVVGYNLYYIGRRVERAFSLGANTVMLVLTVALSIILFRLGSRNDYRDFLVSILMLMACWNFCQLLRFCELSVCYFFSRNAFTFYIYSWPAQAVVERCCKYCGVQWYITTPLMFIAGIGAPIFIIYLYQRCSFLQCKFIKLVLGVRV